MIKRVVSVLCALIISFGLMQAECAAAAFDPASPCSLTLSYTRNGDAFSDLEIEIYRVAKLCDDGSHVLLEPFSDYPIKIHGIASQREWQETAQTIKNYVESNRIEASQRQTTDDKGRVVFTGLETGLYLVKGTIARNDGGTVIFHDFMVYLPTPTQNGYEYDVSAVPKYTQYTEPERYTVVKLWKDAGASARRPESVCAEILKDGVVQERVILDRTNNWSYSWDVPAPGGVWSVMEQDVPAGYQVSITNTGTTFIITNSKAPAIPDDPDTPDDPDNPDDPDVPNPPDIPDTPDDPDAPDVPTVPDTPDTPDTPGTPDDPGGSDVLDEPLPEVPKTGDTAPLLLYVMLLCISGFGLVLLGVLKLRERSHEKNR